jgi:hypothetical protein
MSYEQLAGSVDALVTQNSELVDLAKVVIQKGNTSVASAETAAQQAVAAAGQASAAQHATELDKNTAVAASAAATSAQSSASVSEQAAAASASAAATSEAAAKTASTEAAGYAEVAQTAATKVAVVKSYAALRAYSGNAEVIHVTNKLVAGTFDRTEEAFADNDGTYLVDALGRSWARRNAFPYMFTWFGAIGDGLVDDTGAMNKTLLEAHRYGITDVYIQPGYTFRKADTTGYLVFYPGTTLRGGGDRSVIFHDDRPTNPRRDMLQIQPSAELGVSFRDFRIKGTVEQFPVETNQSQCLTGDDFRSLFMENVTIDGCRFMSTAFSRVHDAMVVGCRIRNSMRDGIRFTQSRNVKVIGNHFFKVADDCVALHSSDPRGNVFLPYNHVVSDNTMEYSQGICVLGAKQLKIHGNNMRFMLRHPIRVGSTSNLPEGNTPMFDISVQNNEIMDTLALYNAADSDLAIRIDVRERTGPSTVRPGVGAPQFDYNWIGGAEFQAGQGVNPGGWGIKVANNKISRSQPAGGVWTDLGDGMILDRLGAYNPPGFYNPAITATMFDIHGVRVTGPARGLTVSSNEFTGLGIDKTCIKLGSSSSSGVYEDYTIHDNKIIDCPGVGIDLSMAAGLHRNASVRNNVIDLDPLLRHPDHNADNTWGSTSSTTCIYTGAAQSVGTADGNVFSHAARITDSPSRMSWGPSNEVVWQPNGGTGLDGTATNRGVRYIPAGVRFINTIYNGDPSVAAFKNITTKPMRTATTAPTTGTYIYGDVVHAAVPLISGNVGSRVVTVGWLRMVTGAEHVIGVDWMPLQAGTGT